jgi:ATP-dependent DNA helicase RecQ
VDVTETAKHLIACVKACRQRYGVTVILDTLHGANTAKIRQYGMNENPHYGAASKVPIYKLRQILNYLLLNDFLMVTDTEYSIVKLTESSAEILESHEPVLMKMAKEREKVEKDTKSKRKKKQSKAALALSGEADEALFEKLRELRTAIAREEKVPPYIVFSDKTLVHMCQLKPKSREEMLGVVGVGEHKVEKYGGRFLEAFTKI